MTSSSTEPARLTSGNAALDEHLGGGLIAGALTVVVGASGIGKTQLGIGFAAAGKEIDGTPGIIFDMASRGDSQSHGLYAERLAGWKIRPVDAEKGVDLDEVLVADASQGDYLHVFEQSGRRVTRRDIGTDAYHLWQAEINRKLRTSVAFFYSNFIRNCRRVIVDGIEPVERAGESIQFDLFEYVYHQLLRKEPEWVARDLFREHYRANAEKLAEKMYDHNQIGCVLLYTSPESMLDDLITRPLEEGDVLSNANTIIYMGKTRDGSKLGRGLYIAKHRGSACSEEIIPYRITENGMELLG